MIEPLFKLGPIEVGGENPPLVVPEIGANHDGRETTAVEMINALAHQGARAVKFQMYTADELVADYDRAIVWGPPDEKRQESIGGLFGRLSLSHATIERLHRHAESLGLVAFSTAFSEPGFDFLQSIGSPCFKVASSDVNHIPLLRHIGSLRTPVILSLGKSTLGEASDAVETLLSAGCPQLALLHCIAEYPAPAHEMNLRNITTLRSLFPNCVIGLSDHSTDDAVAITATALGAAIVEKHVTLDPATEGPDHWFSHPISRLDRFNCRLQTAFAALGDTQKIIRPCERHERLSSVRSLVLARPIQAGRPLERDDIKIVRPGTGLSPRHLDDVIGLAPFRSFSANVPITWEMFKS